MIRKVAIRRFKRFDEVEFVLPDNIVLAGPNNTGKTTVLQAIAAWSLALNRWKELNDFQRHGGAYPRAPIARQAFSAVPLRAFDLLWNQREYRGPVEVLVQTGDWAITMEFISDSTEQIYVRPKRDAEPTMVRSANLATVFVPAMSGLGVDEPVYQRPKIDQMLGQAKPGDVLRNLLVEANASEPAWRAILESIRRLFGYDLSPPDATGAHIVAEYSERSAGARFDIASAGSGFQQVLMLLTFLNTRPGAVLLLDEPDAHLHVILQDAIYGELRSVAAKQRSQLVIATHSEVIINSVEPRDLCVLMTQPRMLADSDERALLIKSLGVLSNEDILLALDAPGVLYLEDYTDLEILRAWAKTLGHPAHEILTTRLFWRKTVAQPRPGAEGIKAKDHYEALRLIRDLPGLELLDGDARSEIPPTPITGHGLQRLRWRRYEIESYLFHPAALARYVEYMVGPAAASAHADDLRKYLNETQPPAFLRDPLADHPFLIGTKARTELIPPALAAAGLPDVPYTRYHEIAALMPATELHPEVKEKLDGIVKALGQ
ncbi:AAA family ATPase [Candidatus Binatia bacterium]|nr:AAA family ATPase [Candidatus Binatia bacterium]